MGACLIMISIDEFEYKSESFIGLNDPLLNFMHFYMLYLCISSMYDD